MLFVPHLILTPAIRSTSNSCSRILAYVPTSEISYLSRRLAGYFPDILNADDLAVMTMESRSKAKVFKVGFYKESDLRIFNFENRSHQLDGGYFRPDGISFKLEHKTSVIPIIEP